MVFVATDGRRFGPSLSVNICADSHTGNSRSDTGRPGADVHRVRQLRVSAYAVGVADWQWCGAAMIERATGVIVVTLNGGGVVENDAVGQRAAVGSAAVTAGNIAGQCALYQRARIRTAATAARSVS